MKNVSKLNQAINQTRLLVGSTQSWLYLCDTYSIFFSFLSRKCIVDMSVNWKAGLERLKKSIRVLANWSITKEYAWVFQILNDIRGSSNERKRYNQTIFIWFNHLTRKTCSELFTSIVHQAGSAYLRWLFMLPLFSSCLFIYVSSLNKYLQLRFFFLD